LRCRWLFAVSRSSFWSVMIGGWYCPRRTTRSRPIRTRKMYREIILNLALILIILILILQSLHSHQNRNCPFRPGRPSISAIRRPMFDCVVAGNSPLPARHLVLNYWRLVLSTANNAQPTDPYPQNVPGNHSEFGFDSHNLDSNIAVLAFPSESQLPISAGMAGNSYDPTANAIVSVVGPCVPPCRRQFNLRTILLRRILKSNALFPTG
jgi:hypothetical protein